MLELKLKNYRRFHKNPNAESGFHNITFVPGFTLIAGSNGAGKTTLMEALSYSLYGPKRGQKRDIVPDNALGDTEIICELEIDGQSVRVHRWSDSAKLWVNSALQIDGLSGSLSDVNRQLNALLGGLTQRQFEHTYFAQQGDIAGLVQSSNSIRRETIAQILQLDVLQKAVELQTARRNSALEQVKAQSRIVSDEFQLDATERNLLDKSARARTDEKRQEYIGLFQSKVDATVVDRRDEADRAADELRETEHAVDRFKESRDECKDERDQAKDRVKEHDRHEKEHNQIEGEITTLCALQNRTKREAETFEKRIEYAKGCAEAARKHQSLLDQIAACRRRINQLPMIKDRQERLTKAKSNQVKLDNLLKQLRNADQELTVEEQGEVTAKKHWEQLEADPTAEDFKAWQARKADLDVREEQAKTARETLQEVSKDAPCPTCNEPLSQHKREERLGHLKMWQEHELPRERFQLAQEESDLKRRRVAWHQEKNDASEAWRKAREAVGDARQRVDRRDLLKEQYDAAAKELQAAQQAWNELDESVPYDPTEEQRVEQRRRELEKQADKFKEDADLFNRLSELREELRKKEDEVKGYGQKIRKCQVRQSKIGYNSTAHEAAKRALAAAEKRLLDAQKELQTAELKIERCKSVTLQTHGAFERANRLQRQLEEDITRFLSEDRLLTLLSGFLNYFFEANTKQVSQRASELIVHAVQDGSILGIEFDKDGKLYYLDASYARREVTKTRPSGGERALIGLCLRVALAEQAQSIARVGKLRFLVLDEVLSSLDDERRDAVQQIFEDVQRRGIFEHIIMITHLEAVKQGWRANGLEVRKLDGKASEVVAIPIGEAHLSFAEEMEV